MYMCMCIYDNVCLLYYKNILNIHNVIVIISVSLSLCLSLLTYHVTV